MLRSLLWLPKAKTIYLLAKVNVPKKTGRIKSPTITYEIVSLENGKAKEYELKLNDKYIDKVDVILDKKDNIKCFGFYADMQKQRKAEGRTEWYLLFLAH